MKDFKYYAQIALIYMRNGLPIGAHYYLCKALGEANRLHDKRAIYHTLKALTMVRRHKDYRAI